MFSHEAHALRILSGTYSPIKISLMLRKLKVTSHGGKSYGRYLGFSRDKAKGGRAARGGVNINRHCKDLKILSYFLIQLKNIPFLISTLQRSLQFLTPYSSFKGLSQGRISPDLNDWVERRDKKRESCCPRI